MNDNDIPAKLVRLYLEASKDKLEKSVKNKNYADAIIFESEVSLLENLLIASGNKLDEIKSATDKGDA